MTTFLFKELRCPVADSTKTLDDKGLAFGADGEITAFSERFHA